jgi:hypothetical protein
MPPGEFLYVKWRLKQSGQVYEDKVDLKNHFPADITDFNVHFFIRGPQLYIYLISPEKRPLSWPIGPLREYQSLKQYQIYPYPENTKSTMVNHYFSFNTIADSPEAVTVLDYQYGNSLLDGTHLDKELAYLGKLTSQTDVYGTMEPGNFLYVKWRIEHSQKVYEDRVDLKNRLPVNMSNFRVHFIVNGSQLYVYLIPPEKQPLSLPIGLKKTYTDLTQYQIYPRPAK